MAGKEVLNGSFKDLMARMPDPTPQELEDWLLNKSPLGRRDAILHYLRRNEKDTSVTYQKAYDAFRHLIEYSLGE